MTKYDRSEWREGSLIDEHSADANVENATADSDAGDTATRLPPLAAPRLPRRCTYCGSLPTAFVDFYAQRGFIFFRRRRTFSGPFCRDCGIATFRKATARTLVAGWWGIGALFTTPAYLISNAKSRRVVGRLSEPEHTFDLQAPLWIDRPIYLRWQINGIVIPVILVGAVVAGVIRAVDATTIATTHVGSCVRTDDVTQLRTVNCSQYHDGVVTKIVTSVGDCPASTTTISTMPDLDSNQLVCIGPA